MVEFRDLFNKMIFVGLFIFAMFMATVMFQDESRNEELFRDDPIINDTLGNLSSQLEVLSNESQAQKELFESDSNAGIGFLLFGSIISAGKVFNSMIVGVSNALIKLPVAVLGFDPIIASVLVTILIVTIIIGLWRVYKVGG